MTEKFCDCGAVDCNHHPECSCDRCGIDLTTLATLKGQKGDPNFHRMAACSPKYLIVQKWKKIYERICRWATLSPEGRCIVYITKESAQQRAKENDCAVIRLVEDTAVWTMEEIQASYEQTAGVMFPSMTSLKKELLAIKKRT